MLPETVFLVPFCQESPILCLSYLLVSLIFCSMVGTNIYDTDNIPSASSIAGIFGR